MKKVLVKKENYWIKMTKKEKDYRIADFYEIVQIINCLNTK